MSNPKAKLVNKVTFKGSYYTGVGKESKAYKTTVQIPHEVVAGAGAISWFKAEMRDTTSDIYKTFTDEYPDFSNLCTHNLDDLSPAEEQEE